MIVKRPYSREASQYQQTNSSFGFGLSLAQAGLSVSFVGGKVQVTNPKTGQTQTLTPQQWAAMSAAEQSAVSGTSQFESYRPKRDEIGASLMQTIGFPFIAIVNSNGNLDDNFRIYLDGVFLFDADFSRQEYSAYLILFDNTKVDIVKSYLSRVVSFPPVYRGDFLVEKPISVKPGGTSTVFMENIQDNGNDNYGEVFYGILEQDFELAYPLDWNPSAGESQSLSLDWPQSFARQTPSS